MLVVRDEGAERTEAAPNLPRLSKQFRQLHFLLIYRIHGIWFIRRRCFNTVYGEQTAHVIFDLLLQVAADFNALGELLSNLKAHIGPVTLFPLRILPADLSHDVLDRLQLQADALVQVRPFDYNRRPGGIALLRLHSPSRSSTRRNSNL